ncbi:MAG: CheR family methyltransferase [Phycisphaerae bacterium]
MPITLVKLSPNEFADMTELVYNRTGIFLPESKLNLLSNRLRRRLRQLNLESFRQYYELLLSEAGCKKELPFFLSAVTTNETYFFRNDALWDYLRKTWIPERRRHAAATQKKSMRIWSAASSSGEEAYTAAICLRETLQDFSTWQITIVGTDISQKMLDHARAGIYNDYAVSKTPAGTLQRWFKKADDGYRLKDEIKRLVRFQFHNLRDALPEEPFDLVFLRNVLMYFDEPMKQTVLGRVTDATQPGGYVFIGDVDPVRSTPALRDTLDLEFLGPNLYRKPSSAHSPACGGEVA